MLGRLLATVTARSEIAWLMPLLPLWIAAGMLSSNDVAAAGDEGPFLRYAMNLVHGGYATPGTSDATQFLWHGPGLPGLLAPLVALGAPLPLMRLTGPLLLFLAIVLFHRLLRARLSRGWALAGAWMMGCYVPFGEVVGPLHKEPLALVLLVGTMLATTRYLDHGRLRHLLLAGLALAALAMTREEFGWVIVVLLGCAAVWHVVRRSSVSARTLRICGVAFLGCLPWLVYTYSLTGRLFYWGNAGGLSLYWMAPHAHQLGAWHSVNSVFSQPSLASFRPFFRHVEALPPLQRDSAFQHAAIVGIMGDPAGYARNLLANVARSFVAAPISNQVPLVAVLLEAAFSLPLLVALARSMRWLAGRRRLLRPETVPFALFGLLGFLIHVPPSSEPRLLLPLVPVALWFVVHAAAARSARAPSRGAAVPG